MWTHRHSQTCHWGARMHQPDKHLLQGFSVVWSHWVLAVISGPSNGSQEHTSGQGMLFVNSRKTEKHWSAVCRGAGLRNMDLWIQMRGPTHSLFSAKKASFHWWISTTGPSLMSIQVPVSFHRASNNYWWVIEWHWLGIMACCAWLATLEIIQKWSPSRCH